MRLVGVVITQFLEFVKKLQSHSKATPKLLQSVKSLKIKHLLKFFGVLEWIGKTCPKTHPHPVGTIFARHQPDISIHFSITPKLQKQKQKINQTIERVGFGSFGVVFGVALEWFWSFLTNSKICVITKPCPTPTLDPPHHQTVEIQALHDTNQTLETQALDKAPSKLKNALRFF